ncbi:putative SMP domain-containing protein [Seiridium cardinale]|uniref:SMP domain-containing protein n=1 Tax=Seiridium cardinale TaxID=138064 RepID=A0ABR2XUI0_9PEZI
MSPAPGSEQSAARHGLFKGQLQPPAKFPVSRSYQVPPASARELVVKGSSQKTASREPVQVFSNAVPQPFVDPNLLERRQRAQNQR